MSDEIPEQPSVVVVGGPMDGYEVKLSPGLSMIVGSGRLANLRLDHPEIELAHVKIIWDDAGLSMIDNGSRYGTWVNRERVETTGLLDGDTIEFTDPNAKKKPAVVAPKVRLKIPKGSVPDPPPPPPPTPEELAAKAKAPPPRAPGKAKARKRPAGPRMPDIDPKLAGAAIGGIGAVLLVGYLVQRMFFTAPSISSLSPTTVEMGKTLTITGARFDHDIADNRVWFGNVSVLPTTAAGDTLQVQVPVLPTSGLVGVSVETPIGRSSARSLTALAPLSVSALDPAGALPGDEVVLNGSGFGEGTKLTVGGQEAKLIKVEPNAVRFEMPQVAGATGSVHQVVVTASGRTVPPGQIYLGRLPLVASVEPARGVAGDLVRVRGAGFSGATTAVSVDGQTALVVAGDAFELAVVVPPSPRAQPEALVPVAVQVGGRASAEAQVFTLQRLVEGSWVPVFVAGHLGEGGAPGQATVGTELGPLLVLSAKDESRSVAERALGVAKALNAVVDRARVGLSVAFDAREKPEIAVGVAGSPDLLVKVLPQDAAVYETPPGFPARGAPPTLTTLARHWAALLTDTVAIGTSSTKPRATADLGPPWDAAFAQLRTALPWQYGSGVPSARVVAMGPDLRRKLREAALRVP